VAEQAAYATLVCEGVGVRLSGQDSGRGTFSHRHAALTDILSGEDHYPISHLEDSQASFSVYNSILSEASVLGFEYGYGLESPDHLVLWEAQFGDFANGAQIIIDNFIVSGEQKWQRCSGVVMLLPHGYEGQGPEHSSARLERYLQSCAEDNIIVANCTTPASFYHLLRRQALMKVRKPLVVMSPKSLLRHPECISTLTDLSAGSFQLVLPESDANVEPASVRRVVFCSGKVYYELRQARRERGITNIAIVRLEQLYPFPKDQIDEVLATYPEGVEVTWCQEEPRNMGAWPMVDEWLFGTLNRVPGYAGRPVAASPATGFPAKHKAQQAQLIEDALAIEPVA
jgi:2-oxoglutarate dehydrogenase E1 component